MHGAGCSTLAEFNRNRGNMEEEKARMNENSGLQENHKSPCKPFPGAEITAACPLAVRRMAVADLSAACPLPAPSGGPGDSTIEMIAGVVNDVFADRPRDEVWAPLL